MKPQNTRSSFMLLPDVRPPNTPLWKKIVEIVAVTAAVVYAFVAYFQWREMHRALLLDQRAWIGVEALGGTPSFPEVGKPFSVAIRFRNSGKTPAENVVMWNTAGAFATLPNVGGNCSEATSRQPAKFLIAPNAVLTQPLIVANGAPISAGWDTDLANKGRFYVFGCAVYDDIFQKSHWLKYCGVLNLDSKTFDTCAKDNDTGDFSPPL